MNKSPTETEATAADQETSLPPTRRNILYRLQRYGCRKFPSLIPHPDRLEMLRTSRSRDEEENLKTEPPSDELIDLRCIWVVEFYTPSQIAQLLRRFEKLGWNNVNTGLSQHSPTLWIQRLRETAHGGGWFNLGPIHRPGDRRFFHIGRTASLPSEVEYALAAMYSLTSSITCIVIGFVLDEKYSGRLNGALKRKRQTIMEPLTRGSYSFPGPASQKAADIRAIRAELRESAVNWFRTHLPGIFAGGLLEDVFPTCEFVTLRRAMPFPKAGERDCEAEEWLCLLDIDNDIDAWEADGLPSLKFTWPLLRDEKSRFHAVVAAKEDAFSAEELRAYGGGSRTSYVVHVDRLVNGLLSRWALLGMLTGFERHLNNIRDSATFKPAKRERPLHLLRELSEHVSQSVDIAAASVELRHFAEQENSFEYELETFKPSDPRFYRDKGITLSRGLRKKVEERSVWLENIDRSIRDLLIQYGTILGAREDIKLQKSIRRMTGVMVILTIFMAVLTALTIYIALKTGKVFLPW